MPELVMACAKLKTALENPSAVERYTIMHAKSYQHPGWVEQEAKLKGAMYGRRKIFAR